MRNYSIVLWAFCEIEREFTTMDLIISPRRKNADPDLVSFNTEIIIYAYLSLDD